MQNNIFEVMHLLYLKHDKLASDLEKLQQRIHNNAVVKKIYKAKYTYYSKVLLFIHLDYNENC